MSSLWLDQIGQVKDSNGGRYYPANVASLLVLILVCSHNEVAIELQKIFNVNHSIVHCKFIHKASKKIGDKSLI